MLRDKIDKFIQNSSFSELTDWMKQNPTLLYQSMDSLLQKFGDVKKDALMPNEINDLFNALYINRESVSEIEFNLLETLTKTMITQNMLTSEGAKDHSDLFLFMLFISSYDIVNKVIPETFVKDSSNLLYQVIMDVYLPTESGNTIANIFSEFYSLSDMIEHVHDTKWFISIYEKNTLNGYPCSMKELLLVFRFISDIYSNREAKLDFFYRYHRLCKGAYAYKNNFTAIEDRYSKFFKDDTGYMIATVLQLLESDDVNESSVAFIKDFDNHCVDAKIVQCFIHDVMTLSNFIPTMKNNVNLNSQMNVVCNIIAKMWGTETLTHEVYPMSESTESIIDLGSPYSDFDIATEMVHKDSAKMHSAEKSIYKAYRTYKDAEEKVDSQITKAVSGLKDVAIGDVRTEIIEGKQFSAIGLLKKLLGTVALFSFGPIKGAVALVVKYALKKQTSISERSKIIMELETEIKMIDEKIQDAKGDNNREAKYAMMRTKAELENALKRIEYGLEADKGSLKTAKATIDKVRGGKQ